MDTKKRTKPKLKERFPIFLFFSFLPVGFFAGSFGSGGRGGGGTNYHFFFFFAGGGRKGRSKSETTTHGERRRNLLLLFVSLIREKKSKLAGAGFAE